VQFGFLHGFDISIFDTEGTCAYTVTGNLTIRHLEDRRSRENVGLVVWLKCSVWILEVSLDAMNSAKKNRNMKTEVVHETMVGTKY
jgi:hypothetical protein